MIWFSWILNFYLHWGMSSLSLQYLLCYQWNHNPSLLIICKCMNSLQNAEALVKGVPTVIMGQAHATMYRQYVLSRFVTASGNSCCASPTCRQPKKGVRNWVECENCLAWWHCSCAGVPKKPSSFYCTHCTKRIEQNK